MGEVYRARDAKLGRDVALKVLPGDFANDAQRMARFEREAQLLAALNHPSIAAIYGLDESGAVRALVMELVEGPTLADRIAQRPLPLDEALPIAKQIAEALEYAHERGIIHRDLKPANIKITPDGAVKILDFGLAKALEREASAVDISSSPTISRMATQAGMILGTAAYMSPEQARGKSADRRGDIWAFGCVLFEMLTGGQPFSGETVSDILAAIIKETPDWTRLSTGTPVRIRVLLQRCLQKDPRQRLQAIGEARIAVEEVLSGAPEPLSAATPAALPVPLSARRAMLPWGVAAVLALAVAAFAVAYFRQPTQSLPVVRLTLVPPGDGDFFSLGSAVAVSPDGSHVAFVFGSREKRQLYLRALDQAESSPLAGTEGASDPIFSPDGRWVAFFAGAKLKKLSIFGGAPVTICDAADPRGAAWGSDGTILFTPIPNSPLVRVSASGGAPQPLTKLNSGADGAVRSHRWPQFLPGGKAALFNIVYSAGNALESADVAVVSLDSGEYKTLLRGGSFPRFASPGYILYVNHNDLLAVPFNSARLEVTGPPVTVLKGVDTSLSTGGAEFAFSESGILAYLPQGAETLPKDRLVWVDRRGMAVPISQAVHSYGTPGLLKMGKQLVVGLYDNGPSLWLDDLSRDTLGPLAVGTIGYGPAISPDGRRVFFGSNRGSSSGIFARNVDGSGAEARFTTTTWSQFPNSVSPDGKLLIFTQASSTGTALLQLPLEGSHNPQPLFPGPGTRTSAMFSPDGRSIAYVSDESGQAEVYEAPFPDEGPRIQISSGGGSQPLWSRNGRELFFRQGQKMMAAGIRTGPAFSAEKPYELFEGLYEPIRPSLSLGMAQYDVTPDGQRFLMIQPVEQPAPVNAPVLHIVLNWFEELHRLAASGNKGPGT